MTISPGIEEILINLAARGMWIDPRGDHLRVVATNVGRPTGHIPTDLSRQIASNRAELIRVVPGVNQADYASYEVRCRWKRRTQEGWQDCPNPVGSSFYCHVHDQGVP